MIHTDQPRNIPEHPHPGGGIPEGAPIVSMDVGLGERYQSVTFDYNAFMAESERLGFPAEALGGLSIRVDKEDNGGNYDSEHKVVDVGAGKRINDSLSHEMQHAADDANGRLDSTSLRHTVGALSTEFLLTAGTPLSVVDSIAMPVAHIVGNHTLERISFGTAVVIGAAALGFFWGYIRHPAERRAGAAEGGAASPVIQLVER